MKSLSTSLLLVAAVLLSVVAGAKKHVPGTPGAEYPEAAAIWYNPRPFNFSIVMSEANLRAMGVPNEQWWFGIEQPDVPVDSITINGREVYTNVSISYKGNYGSFVVCMNLTTGELNGACGRMSYSITFDKYDESIEWYGMKKVHLNSMWPDPTLLKERFNSYIFGEAVVPVPRSTYATVYINNQFMGIHLLQEADMKKGYAKDRFPESNGFTSRAIFKDAWPVFKEAEFWQQQAKTSGKDSDKAVKFLSSFGAQVQAAVLVPPQPLIENIQNGEPTHPLVQLFNNTLLDFNMHLRWMVIDRFIMNADSAMQLYADRMMGVVHPLCAFGCHGVNFLTFHTLRTEDSASVNRLIVTPHDLDGSWYAGLPLPFDPDWFDYRNSSCERIPSLFAPEMTMLPPRCDPLFRAMGMYGVRHYVNAWNQLRAAKVIDKRLMLDKINEFVIQIDPVVQMDSTVNRTAWQEQVAAFKELVANRIVQYDQVMNTIMTNECAVNNGGCGATEVCRDDFIGFHCVAADPNVPAALTKRVHVSPAASHVNKLAARS